MFTLPFVFLTVADPMSVKRTVAKLHPRNIHQGRYNIKKLCAVHPNLKSFIKVNPRGENTIDFADPEAVLCLNQALLSHYYQVKHWRLPAGYLCPPIPGRADYIHYAADLLGSLNLGRSPVKVLDIGTGANLIYPIIGSQAYHWSFVASDIDPVSVKSAQDIVDNNPDLSDRISVVHQTEKACFFKHVIREDEQFALTVCNPPFHASRKEAEAGTRRKWNNLKHSAAKRGRTDKVTDKKTLNFGGQSNELWCDGGEIVFLSNMVTESVNFAQQVGWFTSLVSKKENIAPLQKLLEQKGAKQIKVKVMSQGQKISHMLAWSFLTVEDMKSGFSS